HQLDIISFQNGKISEVLYEQQVISVAGYVEVNEWNGFSKPQMQMFDLKLQGLVNEWNGFSKPQMQMFDLKLQGPAIIDQRTSELTKDHLNHPDTDYIF